MNAFYRVSSFAGALTVVVAMFAGAYFLLSQLWTLYLELDFVVRTVVLTVAASTLIAASMIAGSIRSNAHARKRAPLVAKQYAAYLAMINDYSAAIDQLFARESSDASARDARRTDWHSDVLLLASKDVLARQSALEAALVERTDTPRHVRNLFQELVNSIRRDLGSRPVEDGAIAVLSKKIAAERKSPEESAAYPADVESPRPV